MKYQVLLFDFDGTLLDSDFMIALTMYELYREFRPDYRPHLRDMFLFSGPPLLETMEKEFPDRPKEKMRDLFVEKSRKYYLNTAVLYPGAYQFLTSLKEKGILLGLATSKFRGPTDLSLNLVHLEGIFDATVAGDEVKHNKPDPEPLLKALDLMGYKGPLDKVLYVGDSAYDEQAAKALGLDMALAKFAPRKLLEGYRPTIEFTSYDELKEKLYGNL